MRSLDALEKELGAPIERRIFEQQMPSWVQLYACGCELLADISKEYSWLRVCPKHQTLAGAGVKHKLSDELRESLTPNARILLTILITVARPPNRFIAEADLKAFLSQAGVSRFSEAFSELLDRGYIVLVDSNYVITPHLTEALYLEEN